MSELVTAYHHRHNRQVLQVTIASTYSATAVVICLAPHLQDRSHNAVAYRQLGISHTLCLPLTNSHMVRSSPSEMQIRATLISVLMRVEIRSPYCLTTCALDKAIKL